MRAGDGALLAKRQIGRYFLFIITGILFVFFIFTIKIALATEWSCANYSSITDSRTNEGLRRFTACSVARDALEGSGLGNPGNNSDPALNQYAQQAETYLAQRNQNYIPRRCGPIDIIENPGCTSAAGLGSTPPEYSLAVDTLRGGIAANRSTVNTARSRGVDNTTAAQMGQNEERRAQEQQQREGPVPVERPCSGSTGAMCTLLETIQNFIIYLLGLIVNLLGKLVTLLVDILISFASYNGFSTALPVVTGWVIVRDVVNMFFIVILLVSAFATIIQYDTSSFHYTKVLPKLLLMAVLINFSRTLIQLLVDFSQVLMLTFVNAFQQAAAGNFVNALKLNQILTLANQQEVSSFGQISTATPAQGTVAPVQVMMAYMLGIILLVIASGTLIILIAYIIARIIGLWIALIFAPMAFFSTALPERLKKGMDTFTGKYWARLSGMLTGGPIVAFFLWLSLATVQQSVGSGAPLVTVESGSAIPAFISQVGNSQDLASFIVAIAMMLLGLEAAVSAAGQVSESVGKFAGSVQGMTKSVAGGVAKAPALAGLYAARGGLRAGRAGVAAGYKAVDKRADITGKMAGALRRVPGADLVAGDKLRELQLRNRTERKKEVAERSKGFDSMTRDELAFEANRRGNTPADKELRAKALEAMSSDSARANFTKKRSGELEEEMKGKKARGEAFYKDMSDDEIKKSASSMAMTKSNVENGQHIAAAKKIHEELGNTDKVKELDAMVEKNPALEENATKRDALYAKIRADVEKIKALTPEAITSASNIMNILPEGAIQRDASGSITGVDQAKVDAFKEQNKDNKNLTTNVDALIGHIKATPSMNVSQLQNAMIQKDSQGRLGMYSGLGRMRSGKEQAALAGMQTNITAPTNHGRSGPDTFGAAASAAFAQAVQNLPLDEALRVADAGTGDQAAHVEIELIGEGGITAARTAATDTDRNAAMKPITKITMDLENPNIGSATQNRFIAGVRNGGAGSAFIEANIKKMDSANKEAMVKLVKIAAARERDANAKPPASRTAEEREVIKFMEELRTAVPPDGVGSKHILRNVLHGTQTT